MARYYLDNELTIRGIVPGSVVGVWREDSDGNPDLDCELFRGKVDNETVSIPIPAGQADCLIVRVRKYEMNGDRFRNFETPYYITGGHDRTLEVAQIRDI